MTTLQNRERTGVPKRAARLGWWMRPDDMKLAMRLTQSFLTAEDTEGLAEKRRDWFFLWLLCEELSVLCG